MANLLSQPDTFSDMAANQPPACWNGSAYAVNNGGEIYGNIYIFRTEDLAEGDTLSGTYSYSSLYGDDLYLLYFEDGSPVDAQLLTASGSFSFPVDEGSAAVGLTIGVLDGPDSYTPANVYGLQLVLNPGATPPPVVSYNCECDDDYPRRTLLQMREELRDRLGFMADQGNPPARTMLSLRTALQQRLGFAGQTMLSEQIALLRNFLYDAQETIYREIEMDYQGAYSLASFDADSDSTTVDPQVVFLLALANAKAHYGQPDAKNYADQAAKYLQDMLRRSPPNLTSVLNKILKDAQEQAYRMYRVFRMERFFTWQLEEGVRFYDFAENEDVCTKRLDPRLVTWVGTSDNNDAWRPLVCGIKPTMYYGAQTGWPSHYEIRQCIEVWPAPSSDPRKLRIKGYFGLGAFDVDADTTTIDVEAIRLLALANAKAHFKAPDAANYMSEFRTYIGLVTAGSHHTRRYVPGAEEYFAPPLPVLTGYPGDP